LCSFAIWSLTNIQVNSAAFVKSIFFIVANRICNDVERLISDNSESPSSEVEREIREVRRTFGLFLYASAANEVLILLIQENHGVETMFFEQNSSYLMV